MKLKNYLKIFLEGNKEKVICNLHLGNEIYQKIACEILSISILLFIIIFRY